MSFNPTTLISILSLVVASIAHASTPAASPVLIGEQIYRQGKLTSGDTLLGERTDGGSIRGIAAACVSCHRRSGLGTKEGQIVIPPITGKYLQQPLEKTVRDASVPQGKNIRVKRSPYTNETLAKAIREGMDSDGRQLNYLMPRFNLNDTEMTALIEYLNQLTSAPVPGVFDDVLHFATIITPDADPVVRKGMLEVMEKFIADKNGFQHGGVRPLKSTSRSISYRVKRRWQLHVWDLTGAADTWQQQLQTKLAAAPVFAVISGLGGKNWEPVHRFCEQAALPCLFPNVELPIDASQDFYSVYFSRALLLEPELILHDLQQPAAPNKTKRLIQLYRQSDIGVAAAKALQANAETAKLKVINHALPAEKSAADISKALKQVTTDDVVILWLRPEDIAALPPQIVDNAMIYVSGSMAGLENAPLPAAWRSVAKIAYPFDLPDKRVVRMNYPLGWFKIRQIAVVNEQVQTDTYLACGILSEISGDMLDSFVRDYLVERVEVMLSQRLITGYYPRLSLAPGQRFASKGGYIAHFADAQGKKLVADSEWIIP